ncbi:hypothetical protein ABBQ38_015056 [Trebouxia sp. C0009 RCD-2024]
MFHVNNDQSLAENGTRNACRLDQQPSYRQAVSAEFELFSRVRASRPPEPPVGDQPIVQFHHCVTADMGLCGPATKADRAGVSGSEMPEEIQHLVQDALRCFSLVQVLNGAIASLVTLAGYLYKHTSLTDPQALPWSLLRFGLLGLVGVVTHKALSTKRDTPWNVNRHTLVHAAIFMQLAWFSSELVLASTAVALAPRIMGQPQEETQFSYVPPSAALQVYGCGVLITIGAALCFSSRQRCRLQSARGESIQSARGESMAGQFIQQSRLAVSSSAASHDTVPAGLIQPLLPESAV